MTLMLLLLGRVLLLLWFHWGCLAVSCLCLCLCLGLQSLSLIFQVGVVWLGNELDVLMFVQGVGPLCAGILVITTCLHLLHLPLRIHADAAVIHGLVPLPSFPSFSSLPLFALPVLDGLTLLNSQIPPPLLIHMFLILTQIQRLVVLPSQFLLSPQFVPNSLVDTSSTTCTLDVSGVHIPIVGLVHGQSVLVCIFLGTGQHSCLFDLGVVELSVVMLPTHLREIVLPGWDLGWEFLGLAIVPSSVRQVSLLGEGTGLVIAELVIPHNKITKYPRKSKIVSKQSKNLKKIKISCGLTCKETPFSSCFSFD